MANDTYAIDLLATGSATITLTDDGTGSDWLVMTGTYAEPTDIRLGWTRSFGTSTSASGFYFNPGNMGHRLIVEGLIENVRGSNGRDAIQGNELDNILFGDALAGGAGGNDTISAGEGDDTVYAGAGDDVVDPDLGDDLIFGGTGADTLNGGSGVDTIQGGRGADVMYGGSDTGDTVSYAGSSAAVRVTITYGSATTGVGGDAAGDTIGGFGHVIGSGHDDVLTDSVKPTVAFGYNDNRFDGGAGNDRLALGGGDDLGLGGDGRDTVLGELGNDTLKGEAGNDRITGGLGADRLYGGGDADQFVYTSLADSSVDAAGRDQISDFSQFDGDRIDLRQIDAVTGGSNDAFAFIGTSRFSGTAGEVRTVNTLTGILVQADVNGDRIADFSVKVVAAFPITADDFLL